MAFSTRRVFIPSNLCSRFFSAPFVGALVQEILTNPECGYRSELSDIQPVAGGFQSVIGKTEGALSPNGFWYWWRRFIPNRESREISSEEEKKIDVESFRKSLTAIQSIWRKSFATKGTMLQFNLEKLLKIFPKSLFIHIRREPFFNIQSLLLTRDHFYEDRYIWYSVKPPGYEALLDMSPEQQVAGQVYLTNKSISQQFAKLPEQNCLEIQHEFFCESPESVYRQLQMKLNKLGYKLPSEYTGEKGFKVRKDVRVSANESQAIWDAYQQIAECDSEK